MPQRVGARITKALRIRQREPMPTESITSQTTRLMPPSQACRGCHNGPGGAALSPTLIASRTHIAARA
jgi:hypothetical protein